MPANKQIIQISQIDIAVKQLKTAIKIFFSEEDPISVYTLARNSEEILSIILKKEHKKNSIWQYVLNQVKQEYLKKFRTIADEPRNIFKHKRLWSHEICKFDTSLNDFFLCVGVSAIRENWSKLFMENYEFIIYNAWYAINNPEILKQPLNPALDGFGFRNFSKKDFYLRTKEILEQTPPLVRSCAAHTPNRNLH